MNAKQIMIQQLKWLRPCGENKTNIRSVSVNVEPYKYNITPYHEFIPYNTQEPYKPMSKMQLKERIKILNNDLMRNVYSKTLEPHDTYKHLKEAKKSHFEEVSIPQIQPSYSNFPIEPDTSNSFMDLIKQFIIPTEQRNIILPVPASNATDKPKKNISDVPIAGVQLSMPSDIPQAPQIGIPQAPPIGNPKVPLDEFLSQIREGTKLKKYKKDKGTLKPQPAGVESMMDVLKDKLKNRRMAVDEEDEEEWDEPDDKLFIKQENEHEDAIEIFTSSELPDILPYFGRTKKSILAQESKYIISSFINNINVQKMFLQLSNDLGNGTLNLPNAKKILRNIVNPLFIEELLKNKNFVLVDSVIPTKPIENMNKNQIISFVSSFLSGISSDWETNIPIYENKSTNKTTSSSLELIKYFGFKGK